jgi:hypothetical protein
VGGKQSKRMIGFDYENRQSNCFKVGGKVGGKTAMLFGSFG